MAPKFVAMTGRVLGLKAICSPPTWARGIVGAAPLLTRRSTTLPHFLVTRDLVLSGNGEVYVSGITSSGPLSVYVTSGSQQELFLSYQATALSGSSVTQTVTLGGADPC